ncbi:MAG: B12-binding domain-containing radical SAM protein [Oliverpabstia sp.]|nr:B12-binding domain-containing radical SAM protein [Oliverpabstia sp.]
MRILLTAVNAKYIHSNLAVYSLKAYANRYGEDIGLAEFTINQKKDEILKGIFRRQPEVLCISCYIWNISLVKEVIREIHKILPDTAIWLGGPEVSYDSEKVLSECPQVTGIMKGEGEETFLELAGHYLENIYTLEEIRGITYRKNQEIVDNGWREVMDLSKVPFVYSHLEEFKNRIIYYESSRGCPFSCSYCLSSVDKKLRFRDLELVKKELQFFLDQKVPQVKFVDRTFNCNHNHAMAIWTYLTEHDNGITNFHFEIAADLLNEEEIALIRRMRPGMIQLEIGVQSTNEKTISEIHRKMDFAKVSSVVRKIQEGHNVHQHLDLIAGLPFEDYESFGKSFDQVYALRPQQLQLGFLKVLKGSYMYQQSENYGCFYQDQEPYEVLFTRWVSYEEILKLKLVEEMVEVYYNSNQFLKTLPAVERLFSSPFAFYEALGAFYDRKGYLDISHTRIRRYEILQEFLEEKDPENRELYIQLMTYDLYARENLKNRPTWAKDQREYKTYVREFYRQEAESRKYLPEYQGYDERQLGKMTHLEIMDYHPDTWEPGDYRVLFDYRKRDVLTYEAHSQKIDEKGYASV